MCESDINLLKNQIKTTFKIWSNFSANSYVHWKGFKGPTEIVISEGGVGEKLGILLPSVF